MRRTALAAALSLMLVTLVGGTASAHDRGGHSPAPSFAAAAGSASQGGYLRVLALVRHADLGVAFSASAVVHFKSGDATVTLETKADRRGGHGHHGVQFHRRRGHVLVAWGRAPVGATEKPGKVDVDVTIVYGTQTVFIKTTGLIEGTATDPQPDPPPVYG